MGLFIILPPLLLLLALLPILYSLLSQFHYVPIYQRVNKFFLLYRHLLIYIHTIAIEKSSKELVPGDVLLLPTSGGCMMECYAVLIEGTCVVNESMLTGESIPITKVCNINTSLIEKKNDCMGNFSYSHQISVSDENAPFKYDLQRQHVVFSGTEILQGKAQTGDYCKSVVIRTGNFRQIVNNFLYIHLKLSSRGY